MLRLMNHCAHTDEFFVLADFSDCAHFERRCIHQTVCLVAVIHQVRCKEQRCCVNLLSLLAGRNNNQRIFNIPLCDAVILFPIFSCLPLPRKRLLRTHCGAFANPTIYSYSTRIIFFYYYYYYWYQVPGTRYCTRYTTARPRANSSVYLVHSAAPMRIPGVPAQDASSVSATSKSSSMACSFRIVRASTALKDGC